MVELLIVLTPIGLLDSTSMIPMCIVILVVLLAGPRPLLRSSALIVGIFVIYVASGLLIFLGLQSVFDEISAYTLRLWQNPETEELIFQAVIGAVLLAFGVRIATARKSRTEKPVASDMTAAQAFLAGAGLMIVGLPGAVPYFAAIDLILRAEVTLLQRMLAFGYYNFVFVTPLVAIVALRLILGERSTGILDAVKRFFDSWGQRLIVALLLILGVVLLVDGIGWFLGHPLIPV